MTCDCQIDGCRCKGATNCQTYMFQPSSTADLYNHYQRLVSPIQAPTKCERRSPSTFLFTALNNGQQSVSAEHYDVTVKLTCDLLVTPSFYPITHLCVVLSQLEHTFFSSMAKSVFFKGTTSKSVHPQVQADVVLNVIKCIQVFLSMSLQNWD